MLSSRSGQKSADYDVYPAAKAFAFAAGFLHYKMYLDNPFKHDIIAIRRVGMRIYDETSDRTLERIYLCLTREEAEELRDSLAQMLCARTDATHTHVNDADFSHEITACLYDTASISGFDDRFQKVIREDR